MHPTHLLAATCLYVLAIICELAWRKTRDAVFARTSGMCLACATAMGVLAFL
jgi:uncharacterized membrane protein